jgi:hypothetical protein
MAKTTFNTAPGEFNSMAQHAMQVRCEYINELN